MNRPRLLVCAATLALSASNDFASDDPIGPDLDMPSGGAKVNPDYRLLDELESRDEPLPRDPEAAPRPFEVTVRVVDARNDFTPLNFATVHVIADDEEDRTTHPAAKAALFIHGTQSSPSGAKIALPFPQSYTVTAAGPGYQPGSTTALLRPGNPEVLLLSLERGGALRGRVLAKDGTPLADASVRIVKMRRIDHLISRWPHGAWEATTSAEGRYEVDGIPVAKEIELVASCAGYVPKRYRRFNMDWPATLDGLDFVLEPGRGKISGKVLDPDGKPVENAVVGVLCEEARWFHIDDHCVWSTPGGEFRFDCLPFARIGLEYCAPGFVPHHEPVPSGELTPENPERKVDLYLKNKQFAVKLRVLNEKGEVVPGVMVTEASKSHVPPSYTDEEGRVTYRCMSPGTAQTTLNRVSLLFSKPGYLSSSVEFSMVRRNLSPEEMAKASERNFLISGWGRSSSHMVAIAPGEAVAAPVVLLRPAIVTFRLVPPTRGPDALTPPGERALFVAPISVIDELYRFLTCVRDPRGRFSIEAAPGKRGFLLWIEGFGMREMAEDILASTETVVEVPLGAARWISGRVIARESGLPVPGAEVRLSRAFLPLFLKWYEGLYHRGPLDEALTRTDERGGFRIGDVRRYDNDYQDLRLWARAPGYAVGWSRAIQMRGDADVEGITIPLCPEGTIRGRIVGWDRPEDVAVTVTDRGQPSKKLTLASFRSESLQLGLEWGPLNGFEQDQFIRADGTFELRGMPPGNYRVSLVGRREQWDGALRSDRISLAPAEAREVLIDPAASVPIHGRLTRAGRPVEGAHVKVFSGRDGIYSSFREDEGSAGDTRLDATTGPDGTFELPSWLGGQTRIVVRFIDDTFGWRLAMLDRNVDPGRSVDLNLPECAIEGTVEFEDLDGVPDEALDRGLPIVGSYSETEEVLGEHTAHWLVVATEKAEGSTPQLLQGEWRGAGGRLKDAEGWVPAGIQSERAVKRFRLEGLQAGTYFLKVLTVARYRTTTIGPITVPDGETVRGIAVRVAKDVDRVQSLTIFVSLPDDSRHQRGGTLLLDPHLSSGWGHEDDMLLTFRWLSPARYRAVANGQVFEVQVPQPNATPVAPLKSRGDMLVRVVDRAGQPIEGARVSLRHPSGIEILPLLYHAESITDARGQLWIGDIPAEPYTLEARRKDLVSKRTPVAVTEERPQEVRLIVQETGREER